MSKKDSDAAFESDVEILRRAADEGRFPRAILDEVLVRVDGDVDRFFEDPESITLQEARRLFDIARRSELESVETVGEREAWLEPLMGATLAIPERRHPDHAAMASSPGRPSATQVAITDRLRDLAWLIVRTHFYHLDEVTPEERQFLADALRSILNDLETPS